MSASSGGLHVELKDGVAWARLDRPERLNALDTSLQHEIVEQFCRFDADESVRVVVLGTTSQRAFSVGADLKEKFEPVDGVQPSIPCDKSSATSSRRCWNAASRRLPPCRDGWSVRVWSSRWRATCESLPRPPSSACPRAESASRPISGVRCFPALCREPMPSTSCIARRLSTRRTLTGSDLCRSCARLRISMTLWAASPARSPLELR
jgi:hypothetical protein